LVSSLHGAVSLEQVHGVALGIGQDLDFDVAGVVQESCLVSHTLSELDASSRSIKTVPSPKALLASLTARSKFSLKLSWSLTTRIPRPPPPMAALMMTGKPYSSMKAAALS
jgi:hypothetical protein